MNAAQKDRYHFALDVTHQAGQFALSHFDRDVAVEWKEDKSPVTLADRGAEEMLRTALLGKFPTDGFLGEEFGARPGTSGFRWIIDPIDGTRSFVRGVPIWATLVGLEYKGELIAGITYLPALDQTYRALRGEGAFRNDRPIHVSRVDTLKEAHFFYSSVTWFIRAGREKTFLHLAQQTQRQRGFGDFYGFVLVAQGGGDIMMEHGVHAWDLGGIVPIVEEAGGKITTWDGKKDIERPDVVATNGLLHDTVLNLLRQP